MIYENIRDIYRNINIGMKICYNDPSVCSYNKRITGIITSITYCSECDDEHDCPCHIYIGVNNNPPTCFMYPEKDSYGRDRTMIKWIQDIDFIKKSEFTL